MPAATTVTSALWIYWRGLYLCLVRHGEYGELRTLTDSKRARLQIYMLALSFRLWHQKHYRSGTFQNDMQKNLCNVAVPKTGLPLSALTCVDTYVPGPPYCTYELRVLASCLLYVPTGGAGAARLEAACPGPTHWTYAVHSPALGMMLAITAWSKCPPWQLASSTPVPPQGAPGGPVQLGTPRVRPSHWAPSHRLSCSS